MAAKRSTPPSPSDPLDLEHDDPELRIAAVAVARRLLVAKRRTIGLLPAASDVAAMPLGLRLAAAIHTLTSGHVAFVDANTVWPAFPELAAARIDTYKQVAFHWHTPAIAIVRFHSLGPTNHFVGQALSALVVSELAAPFVCWLVDLTGFLEAGEHLGLIKRLDGVIVLARANVTREDQLINLCAELPAKSNLGILFIGGRID